jgi:hypothetical protein
MRVTVVSAVHRSELERPPHTARKITPLGSHRCSPKSTVGAKSSFLGRPSIIRLHSPPRLEEHHLWRERCATR